jgi:hypothetical protein
MQLISLERVELQDNQDSESAQQTIKHCHVAQGNTKLSDTAGLGQTQADTGGRFRILPIP